MWSIEVFLPVNDQWEQRDRKAHKLAESYNAHHIGGSLDSNIREIQWLLPNRVRATALIKELTKAGFTAKLTKYWEE